MEKSLEDLEVEIKIANARSQVAIDLIRTMIRELSGVVDWNERDLFGSYFDTQGSDADPARDYACLEIFSYFRHTDDMRPGESYAMDMRERERLDHQIRKQIRHDQASRL